MTSRTRLARADGSEFFAPSRWILEITIPLPTPLSVLFRIGACPVPPSDSARPSLIQRRENGGNLAQNQQIGFITLVDQVFFNGFSKEIKLVCKAPIGPQRFGRLSSLGWPPTLLCLRGDTAPLRPDVALLEACAPALRLLFGAPRFTGSPAGECGEPREIGGLGPFL
jgi:hypothetical protein